MISRSVFIRAKCRAEATVSYLPSDTCRAEIYRRQHNSCWSRRTLAISPADHPAGKLLSPDRPEHRRRSQCTQWDRCTVEALHRTLGGHRHRRSEEHTSELQSRRDLVCRLLLEKKNK